MDLKTESLKLYSEANMVRYYASQEALQLPEKTIFQIIGSDLVNASILDIGVGAGRTTPYLAAHASNYIGIDLSPDMIAACREKFSARFPRAEFKVTDVCKLDSLASDMFDLVVFTYNGLDSIDHHDRLKALSEIRRVLKPRGLFVFSTHNLRLARTFFTFFPKCRGLRQRLREMRRNQLRRRHNPAYRKLLEGDYAIIREGSKDFRLVCYFIDPDYQMAQLSACGFSGIRRFSYTSGSEILNREDSLLRTDPWIYYMAKLAA